MLKAISLLTAFLLSVEPGDLMPNPIALRHQESQADFPALTVDAQGIPWVAYVEWDGGQDTLCLAKYADNALSRVLTVGSPGIIHQPTLAATKDGLLVVIWSQVNDRNVMELKAQCVRNGVVEGTELMLASNDNGGNVLARAATDRTGRVWVAWQAFRGGPSDVFCRTFDPEKKEWSTEVQVTRDSTGDWEPCIAFDDKDGAWVIYDSSRGNEFNIYANRLSADGSVSDPKSLIHTDRYEGRVSAVGTPDGRGIWLACERGNQEWGLDMRAHGGAQGLNGRKNSVLAFWDLESGKVEEMPALDPLLSELPGPPPNANPPQGKAKKAKAKAKAKAKTQSKAQDDSEGDEKKSPVAETNDESEPQQKALVAAINLPQVMLDSAGRPWLTVRYFKDYCWQIALARFDRESKQWTKPYAVPDSAYAQDRRTSAALGADGSLWVCWPGDLRNSKLHRIVGVNIAKVATSEDLPLVRARAYQPRPPFPAWINPVTPERPQDEHHTWTHEGTTYKLYWGDFHRHTDVSNCITANDGCVLEQFRYALDMGKLDMLGTSDHTDIAKIYHPYEWWLNQKMVDVFYAPGFFNSMYAYEREQRWPHGHRNIVFAQRGGPIVYIQRTNYVASPWQSVFPVETTGEKELSPQELWDVLTRYGKPVTAISHTGATGMGTDWNTFESVDHRVENVVEIYQGARVSYEGRNAPQPTVGLREGERYNAAATLVGDPIPGEPIRSFSDKDNGLYQNALSRGHKLGVWANSDHISTHTSYGGVYVKEFTREGIIEGLNARRTIAATDKIFVEFTGNGHLLGTEIELTGKPQLAWKIEGTAEIKRVTLVRNEVDYQQWTPKVNTHELVFADESPVSGENRYYLRIEQTDGNMAWSSPIWVLVRP